MHTAAPQHSQGNQLHCLSSPQCQDISQECLTVLHRPNPQPWRWKWQLPPQSPFPTALLWLGFIRQSMGRIPCQAARSQALPMPSEMACCGEGPEAPTGFQQDSGPEHLISLPVVWYHQDPASAWERSLGLGRAEGGQREGRKRLHNQYGRRNKNKPPLTNKELNKEKKPRMSFKSISCGREGAETAKGIL